MKAYNVIVIKSVVVYAESEEEAEECYEEGAAYETEQSLKAIEIPDEDTINDIADTNLCNILDFLNTDAYE